MKILMVNKFLYPRGGAESYFLKIGQYLTKQGHELEYFGMYDEKNTVGNSLNLTTTNMDFHGSGADRLMYPFRIIYSTEAKQKISQVAEHFRPDIVHFNNINFQLTPSIIDAIYDLKIPMVQTVHDYQMICPNHLLLDVSKVEICERCVNAGKWHCAAHKCIHNSRVKSILGSIEGSFYQHRDTYDKVNRFICPSGFIARMLEREKRFGGRTIKLCNFIEKRDTAGAADIEKKPYVLFFGRLAEEKGISKVLDAFRMLPDIPLIIAGGGPLEDLVRNANIPNVEFVGFKTGNELTELIAAAQFSVSLPIWYENCPLSVLESVSLGTPVVATRVGGIPELIDDGVTGVLIDSFDPKAYAAEIGALWKDRERLADMQENCRKKDDYLTLDIYCEKLLKIYEDAIGE